MTNNCLFLKGSTAMNVAMRKKTRTNPKEKKEEYGFVANTCRGKNICLTQMIPRSITIHYCWLFRCSVQLLFTRNRVFG